MTVNSIVIAGLFFLQFLGGGDRPARPGEQSASRFEEANLLLSQGRPIEALQGYRELESEGLLSGALAFNMGVALQQLDSLGTAKAYFILAERMPETRQQAVEALQQLEGALPAQIAKVPRHPWQKVYDVLILSWGVNITLLLFGLSLYGLSAAGILFLLGRHIRIATYASLFSGAFTLVLGVVLWLYLAESRQIQEGVVRVSITPLFEHPESGPIENKYAYEGFRVRSDLQQSEAHPGWSYITLENGSKGWVRYQDVAFIPGVRH